MHEGELKPEDYSIIVMSCDGYSDIWPYFTLCWDKFWGDCPFEIYLVSEQKDFLHSKIKNLKIGRNVGWSDMLIETLNQIKTKNIIYLQEDYLLKGKVDNEKILNYLAVFEQKDAAYFRLIPWPSADNLLPEFEDIGLITGEANYKTSLQTAIWNVEELKKLLRSKESGWDFEAKSMERSKDCIRPFLSIYSNENHSKINDFHYPIDYFATGVLNGKWMIECIVYFRKIGIAIDPGSRGVLSRWDYFYYHHKKTKRNVFFEKMNKNIFRKPWFNKLYFGLLKVSGKV